MFDEETKIFLLQYLKSAKKEHNRDKDGIYRVAMKDPTADYIINLIESDLKMKNLEWSIEGILEEMQAVVSEREVFNDKDAAVVEDYTKQILTLLEGDLKPRSTLPEGEEMKEAPTNTWELAEKLEHIAKMLKEDHTDTEERKYNA